MIIPITNNHTRVARSYVSRNYPKEKCYVFGGKLSFFVMRSWKIVLVMGLKIKTNKNLLPKICCKYAMNIILEVHSSVQR